MQITLKSLTSTKTELTVAAEQNELDVAKDAVLAELAKGMSLAGFRKGHAPKALVEKNADPTTLQTRFLDEIVNDLYVAAVTDKKLRPVARPEIAISKFVPFTTLEFTATVEVVGKITLGDYKKIKAVKKAEKVTDKDVAAVLDDLLRRDAAKKDVERASKDGDEVVIDFDGVDAKTKTPIEGAKSADYPLTIGSNTFIPGFEAELVGLKVGDEKTFDITFPADYGAKELQKKKVTFTIKVKAVRELELPKLDDKFAATVGPVKTVDELKADIRKQLQSEKDAQAQRELENDVLVKLADGAKAEIPEALVDEEVERMITEEKRNILYRGETWSEHLKAEGQTEEEHRKKFAEQAEKRVKTGLVLGEVAEAEKVSVTESELTARLNELKAQYPDEQMQAELAKPDNIRDIQSRILTEKAIAKLVEYATKKQ